MYYYRHSKNFIGIFILLSAFGLFYACKKQKDVSTDKPSSNPVERFFNSKSVIDPTVIAIKASVKHQDQSRNIVDKLISKAGYPLWDEAIVAAKQDTNRKFVYVPFVMDGKKQTKAILMVKISGTDTGYHLLYGSHYRNYSFNNNEHTPWNAKDVYHAFMLFDYQIFQASEFIVSDPRLTGDSMGSKPRTVTLKDVTNSRLVSTARENNLFTVTVNTTVVTCHECGDDDRTYISWCCNATYETESVTYYFDDDNDDWGWYPPTGGGGGGVASPCPGCNWEDTNPCALDEHGHAINFCDAEWQPTILAPAYNPFNASDITVSTGLENIFPCVASFIKDSLEGGKFLAQIAGANIFQDSAYITLSFDTSTRFKTDTSKYSAVTTPTETPFLGSDGITHAALKIELNPWILRHGTKEFMVSNILHEMFHAIFAVRWAQYQNWLQYHDTQYDSNYLKVRYPAFWYGIKNLPKSPFLTPEQDHEIMANNYQEQFKNIMNSFFNPNAPTAIRDSVVKALGYHGLRGTTAWAALPGKGMDTCKYRGYFIAAEKSSTNSAPPDCSSSYHYNYDTDLKMRNPCQ